MLYTSCTTAIILYTSCTTVIMLYKSCTAVVILNPTAKQLQCTALNPYPAVQQSQFHTWVLHVYNCCVGIYRCISLGALSFSEPKFLPRGSRPNGIIPADCLIPWQWISAPSGYLNVACGRLSQRSLEPYHTSARLTREQSTRRYASYEIRERIIELIGVMGRLYDVSVRARPAAWAECSSTVVPPRPGPPAPTWPARPDLSRAHLMCN